VEEPQVAVVRGHRFVHGLDRVEVGGDGRADLDRGPVGQQRVYRRPLLRHADKCLACAIRCDNGSMRNSKVALGSAGSIDSIGSSGSILSIGSTGSILSIGSSGSILSIFSAASVGSVMSALSQWSLLAWKGNGRPR